MEAQEEISQVRLFVAINLPNKIRDLVADVQNKVRETNTIVAVYPDASTAHITIAFIGDVPLTEISTIAEALRGVSLPDCLIGVGNLGCFERGGLLRVLYLTLHSKKLAEFAQKVDQALLPWRKPEEREFMGHTTLARIKGVFDHDKLQAFVAEMKPKGSFKANSFVLQSSVLFPSGPEYEVVRCYGDKLCS